MNPSNSIQAAYDAIKNNEAPLARQLLRQIMESDPKNDAAWHLYAHVAESQQEAIYCLQRAIELNSLNDQARQELAGLQKSDLRSALNEPARQEEPPQLHPAPANPSGRGGAKPPHPTRIAVWIFAGILGLLPICCLGGLLLLVSRPLPLALPVSASRTPSVPLPPPPSQTPLAQLSMSPTPIAGCNCDEAISYLNRTAQRYQVLNAAVDAVDQAAQAGTIAQIDFVTLNGQAKAFYTEQVAEPTPPCLQSFQSETVALFWNWQQSMEFMASGQYSSAEVFIQQFRDQISPLEAEGKKVRALLQACPGNNTQPYSTF